MKTNLLIVFVILTATTFFSSCLRLDDSFFNQSTLSEYKLDNYTGETDFKLDESFHFPDSLVHVFPLQSQTQYESGPTTIYAIYIGDITKISTDTVIMYCHGNRDHMDFYWPRAQLLANTGHKNRFGVMMVDYRGYGMSQGDPTEEGMYSDVEAALLWLKNNGLTNERLVMYGFSLGSAPATKLTAEPRNLTPSKLMLEAPFANAETMLQDVSALAIPGTFATDMQLSNGEEIKSVFQPFFWIHGIDDSFLNIDTHGEVVYKNCPSELKEAHRIAGAGHSRIINAMGIGPYMEAVENFIEK